MSGDCHNITRSLSFYVPDDIKKQFTLVPQGFKNSTYFSVHLVPFIKRGPGALLPNTALRLTISTI